MWLVAVLVSFAAFGFGAASLLFFLVRIVMQNVTRSERLATVFKVLGWFVGNGAVVTTTFLLIDLESLLHFRGANGVAVLGYFLGFGLTVGFYCRDPLVHTIRAVDGRLDVQVVILVLKYRCSLAMAARLMHISTEDASTLLLQAITRIRRCKFCKQKKLDRGAATISRPLDPQTTKEVLYPSHDSSDQV